jgi:aspartate carbamoyltransferase regulatory subunit
LGDLDCSVAIITNAKSKKMKRKDIIKIDKNIDLDLDILGYLDPNITINIIKNDERVEKYHVELPEKIENIIKCKNPRCITSVEQELKHVFILTDRDKKAYRCKYCETLNEE